MPTPVFVKENNNGGGAGAVPNIAVALTGVAAGNLIGVFGKHEGAVSSIVVNDGTDILTPGTYRSNTIPDSHGQWNWSLAANSGNRTYTAVFGADREFPSIYVCEYAPPTGFAWAFGNQNTANGVSSTPSSGNFSLGGTPDGVALGGYAENSGTTTSAEQLGGINVDAAIRGPANFVGNFTSVARRIFTAGFTGAFTATLTGGPAWAFMGVNFILVPTDGNKRIMGQACL